MGKIDLEYTLTLNSDARKQYEDLCEKTGLNLSRILTEALGLYAMAIRKLEEGKQVYFSKDREKFTPVIGYGGVLGTYRNKEE